MATSESVKRPNVFAQKWNDLQPNRKKQVSAGLVLVAVIAVAMLIVNGGDDGSARKAETAQGRIQNALMPEEGARDLGVSAVGRDMRQMGSKQRGMENDIARLKSQLEREQASKGADANQQRLMEEISTVRSELSAVNKRLELQESQRAVAEASGRGRPGSAGSSGSEAEVAPAAPAFAGIRAVRQEEQKAPQVASSASVAGAPGTATSSGALAPASTVAGVNSPGTSFQPVAAEKFFLPAGSIISGVLLSGVDAPSGRQAMKDPVPVLLRVKHNAILPNRYRADIRECFMLLETVGDLASERAMMRAVTLSCTRSDRTVMEVPLAGYAVGEDGKAGLRGKVITKQGQVLGKAALAGFADGLSKAFGGDSQVSLGGLSGESIEQGGLSGTSSALERISEWYLERADELTPTITIDSGRKVTIVVTKGRDLAPLRSKSLNAGDGRVIGRSRN